MGLPSIWAALIPRPHRTTELPWVWRCVPELPELFRVSMELPILQGPHSSFPGVLLRGQEVISSCFPVALPIVYAARTETKTSWNSAWIQMTRVGLIFGI